MDAESNTYDSNNSNKKDITRFKKACNFLCRTLSLLFDRLRFSDSLYRLVTAIHANIFGKIEISEEFRKLFYENEIEELYGPKKTNFFKIFSLYLILFLSSGFGIQSLNFFNEQLNNPFVRFLLVPTNSSVHTVNELPDSIVNHFLSAESRQKYRLDTIRPVSLERIATIESNYITLRAKGMADDHNSPLITEAICTRENSFMGSLIPSVDHRGIIVTLDLLKDLGIIQDSLRIEDLSVDLLPSFIYLRPNTFSHKVPVLLQGVVKQLPFGHQFIIPSKFSNHYQNVASDIFSNPDDNSVSFYIDASIDLDLLKETVAMAAEGISLPADEYNLEIASFTGVRNVALVTFFYVDDKYTADYTIKNAIIEKFSLTNEQIIDAFYKPYSFSGNFLTGFEASSESMLVIFKKLSKVSLFNDALKKYSSDVVTNALNDGSTKQLKGIELEMSSIKMRAIMNIIRGLVYLFLGLILILSLFALYSFVLVLFEKYFQKIEKNIGTFMAFGINIKVVYSIMLSVYIIVTIILSLITAWLLGSLLELVFIELLAKSFPGEIDLFSIFSWYTIVGIIAVVIANMVAFKKASAIFSKWPGDIIYERQQ